MVFFRAKKERTVQIALISWIVSKNYNRSTYRSTFSTMRYKIINRNFYHASFFQTLQRSLEKFEIERIGVIKVILVVRSHLVLLLV